MGTNKEVRYTNEKTGITVVSKKAEMTPAEEKEKLEEITRMFQKVAYDRCQKKTEAV